MSGVLTALWGVFCSEEVKNCTHKKSSPSDQFSLTTLLISCRNIFFSFISYEDVSVIFNVNYCDFLLNTELTWTDFLKLLNKFWSPNSGMWHPGRGCPEVSIRPGKGLMKDLAQLIDDLEKKM